MRKYKIMIIDDHIDRRIDMWRDFFTNNSIDNMNLNYESKIEFKRKAGPEFDIIYPESGELLDEFIRDNKVDGYFLDVYLEDEDNWEIKDVLHLIEQYNPKAPIFVYSSKWKDKEVVEEVTKAFRSSFLGRTPNSFYDTNTIESIVESFRKATNIRHLNRIRVERMLINNMIDSAFGKTRKKLNPGNEEIAILHISDIQYGDKKMTGFSDTIWSEVKRVCQNLIKNKDINEINLVAITGDISMHGKQEEFNMAIKDMDEYLFKKLWPKEVENGEYKERILIVPGNHDFDLNFCTLDYLNSENGPNEGDRQIDFIKAANMLSDSGRKKINDYHDMGFAAFSNYAYSVTGNPIYIQRNHLNFVVDNFTNWGLKILCINTCDGISAEKTNGVEIDEGELKEILNSFDQSDYNYTTLILSHHSPNMISSLKDEEKKNFDISVKQLCNITNAALWLGGHRHISHEDEQKTSFGSIEIFEAPTISLIEEWKETEEEVTLKGGDKVTAYRGFQIIKLKLNNEGKRNIEKLLFIFDQNGIAKPVHS